eukprot:10242712-Ditylum_brightwellii.AAC.1
MAVEEVQGSKMILAAANKMDKKKTTLNFCTFYSSGLACEDDGSNSTKVKSKVIIKTYGCGSCSPHGL